MGCRQRRVPPPAALAGLAALAVAILAGPVAAVAAAPPSPPADSSCQPDKLTVYKMVMHTFWSRDRFPKHYPDWRPPAQWSKVIGRSHDASHVLFRLGRPASAGLRAMVETGHSEVLEDESQGAASAANAGVMDEFTAPPVHSGAGWTQAEFFVDGNHSRVSLMSRIVPSPDWFVGIDSFDLCVDGGWIDTITIEVDPLDAGTDNGFTFTAPNWPTEPQGVVYRITSTHPQHPAGSFYYPSLKRLPPIATFQFIKVKEYELSEVFRHSEDSQHFEVLRAEHPNSIPSLDDGPDAVQQEMEEERQEEERRRLEADALAEAAEGTTAGSVSSRAVPKAVPSGDKADVADLFLNTYGPWGAPLSAGGHSSPAPTGIPGSATGSATGNATAAATSARSVRRKHKTVRKIRAPRDCRVGDWGPWSECSKSCGIGEMQRRRTVVKHPRRGGRACPPLLETKWCGSARDCAKSYFKW